MSEQVPIIPAACTVWITVSADREHISLGLSPRAACAAMLDAGYAVGCCYEETVWTSGVSRRPRLVEEDPESARE